MKLRIYNSAGEAVYAPDQPLLFYRQVTGAKALGSAFIPDEGGSLAVQLQGAGALWSWDGRNSGGQWVQSGAYTLVFTGGGDGGDPVSFSVAAQVLRSGASDSVDVFNSAGERVRHYPLRLGAVSGLKLSADRFVPGQSQDLGLDWGGSAGLAWDGRDDAGRKVASGLYEVRINKHEAGSGTLVLRASVLVLETPSALLAGALAGPSPLRRGQRLRLLAPALGASGRLKAVLYDLAGERVLNGEGRGPALELPGTDALAGGAYVLAVEAEEDGTYEQKLLKLALIH